MALRAVINYRRNRLSLHLYLSGTLLNLSTGSGYFVLMRPDADELDLLMLWKWMLLLVFLLLAPVFYRYFDLLAADRGGLSMEAGLLIMVIGLMSASINEYTLLPVFNLIALVCVYMGYLRLCSLLKAGGQ